jgi:hypothetical protein
MCIPKRRLGPQAKRSIVIGNLSPVAGLLLWNFVHPSGQIEKTWLHGACGLLLGVSIAINLLAFRFNRLCRQKQI